MAQITKEQIIDLINKKIAGQGSAVDVGGALPAILTGLAEMAGNAVSPDSTDMTEQEQMQVRKNLGLYYEEMTIGEKSAQYTDQSESPTLSDYAKISDDTPEKDDIISFKCFGGTYIEDSLVFDDNSGNDGYGVGAITLAGTVHNFIIVVTEDSAGNAPGIYVQLSTVGIAQQQLVYNGPVTVVSKVDEKYLPVAWNQLVTEGTKIAELTIGEETTNVFAPEGAGAIELTGLPTASMTTQEELDAIGLTGINIGKLAKCEAAGLVINSGSQFIRLQLVLADYSSATEYKLKFKTETDEYTVSSGATITVTVTPLS